MKYAKLLYDTLKEEGLDFPRLDVLMLAAPVAFLHFRNCCVNFYYVFCMDWIAFLSERDGVSGKLIMLECVVLLLKE